MQNYNASNMSEDSHLRGNLAQAGHILNTTPTSAAASSNADANTRSAWKPTEPPSQAHGYGNPALGPQVHIHPHLRAPSTISAAPDKMQGGISPPSDEAGSIPGTSAAGMAAQGLVGHDSEDAANDGRKAKRELSQSKRAAQNRAAQRAFRQRKEHYIKKLEQQVREYTEMEQHFKVIQNDNYALREYVIQLQSRLLDLRQDLPPAPPNINLSHQPDAAASTSRSVHPPTAGPVTAPAPVPALGPASAPAPAPPSAPAAPHDTGSNNAAAGTLADVAAAVAGLRAQPREPAAEGMYPKSPYKQENLGEQQTGEDIRRQLQQEGTLPPPSSLRA
ncbi:hypothetical protein DL765_004326 [Monosporascus sp. GIB2]|nr:hypothetical protein DL765_004326 [Monosporascus sp. GIB2]